MTYEILLAKIFVYYNFLCRQFILKYTLKSMYCAGQGNCEDSRGLKAQC
jgi:hypothetical protein